MAESNEGGSWWGGWLQAAKQKSSSALEMMKKDLAEFTATMQSDTTRVATELQGKMNEEGATRATTKVKEGFSKMIGGISRALVIKPEDDDGIPVDSSTGEPMFDQAQARLHAIQIDTGTYLNEPCGTKEQYDKWKESFVLDDKKGDISELLVSKVEVRALYTQLVPSDVSHADFWQRYFYKIHQLELDEDRRRALKKRAEVAAEEQQLEWDEDDDWVDMGGPASPPKQQNLANVSTTELTKRLEDQQQIPSDISEAAHQQVTEIDKTSSTTEETKQENITELSQKEHKGLQKATDNTYKDASTSHGNDTIKTPEILISSESCEITGMGRPIVNEIEDKLQGMEKSCSVVSQDTVTAVNASCQKVDASTKPQEEPVSVATESGTPSENVSQEGEETKTDIQTGVSGAESVNSEPELEKEVVKDQTRTETEAVVGVNMLADLKTKERGDLVMVGSDRTTPTSDGNSKDSTSPDDDWEKDFDLDVTEEDLKMAQEAAKMLAQTGAGMDDESEDWENWD